MEPLPQGTSPGPRSELARGFWESLRHFGLLLGPAQVAELGARGLPPLSPYLVERLRRELNRFTAGDLEPGEFVGWVLEGICRLGGPDGEGTWQRAQAVSTEWSRTLVTGESFRPRHLWTGPQLARFPVFFDAKSPRLGLHRGRKVVSDTLQWQRAARVPLALLTNGRQWRLLFAGLDYDAACEWETEQWFEGGEPGPQLEALRRLLAPALLAPAEASAEPPLLGAIHASRRGQSQLSKDLGERVREAVEALVRSHGPALAAVDSAIPGADLYRAAVRVVMRLVVLLFAESRDLLPRDEPVYDGAYGLRSLLEQLEREHARGPERLRHRDSAWPRILALFRLIHEGCHHEALPVPAYGGELFAPGDAESTDPLARALHVFETACFAPDAEVMPDAVVHRILDLLTRTWVRVRQGRSWTRIKMPVNFADLSSEYLGILYEGLLDYELRAAGDDPVLFLAVGNEPALPLSRLEAMGDRQIKDLFAKLKEKVAADEGEEEETDEEDQVEQRRVEQGQAEQDQQGEHEEAPGDEERGDDGDEDAGEAEEGEALGARELARARAEAWARRACEVAGLIAKPKGKLSPEKKLAWEERLVAKARALARRVVLPGEWYLVRWGGTRKGAGTFYTRPQLAVPIVQRTLRPLAYDPPAGPGGEPDLDAPAERWTPKRPEEILALKVCDPACGSGTFPLAALRFLTDALYAALFHHGRLADPSRPLAELLGLAPPGAPESLQAERLPARPDDDDFEPRTRAVLRRIVVERSIYGVDLDPLAVELCKLALWIETLDPGLPFTFLDHKIRPGNALIGCWFDRFQHYPVLAWDREAGDKGHKNGVHFADGELTKAIKDRRGNVNNQDAKTVRRDLLEVLDHRPLFSEDRQHEASDLHDRARAALEAIHALPVHDLEGRRRRYEELRGSADWRRLHDAFDLWCAVWFWPAEAIGEAPLPSEFQGPAEEALATVQSLRESKPLLRFFHWELEFPDVFNEAEAGFDAILGNPPWENLQPNPEEFFSNHDPLYRTYGQLEKRQRQKEIFENAGSVESKWLAYCSDFKAFSNWVGNAAHPFGDTTGSAQGSTAFSVARAAQNRSLHERWRRARSSSSGYADRDHPFRYQVGRLFTYKLFLEISHALLRRGGRLGLLVPSGVYSDAWSQPLRELFLDRCRWEWLFGFENRDKIFDIDSRFKFNPVIVEKGGATEVVRTAFMRRRLEDWAEAERHATPYGRPQILGFSPNSKALLEIQSRRDLEILDTIYANSVLLGDKGPDGWGIEYALEFMMNTDAHLFPPRPWWEERGYRPDEYSRWLQGDWQPRTPTSPAPPGAKRVEIPAGIILSRDGQSWIHEERVEDVALPLYQGIMIRAFDPSARAWIRGTGLQAVWEPIPQAEKRWDPQFLMAQQTWEANRAFSDALKIGYREVARSTDSRSFIGALLPSLPCGHKVPVLRPTTAQSEDLAALVCLGYLNSLVFDWQLRLRLGSVALAWFVLSECLMPSRTLQVGSAGLVARLNLGHPRFAANWLGMRLSREERTWHSLFAATPAERTRLRAILDATAASAFGLSPNDMALVLAGCDYSIASSVEQNRTRKHEPKGFWRVDKDKDPELRHTVLTLVAFHDLQQKIADHGGDRDKGIEAFLTQNDGEGWMLPDELRLEDYGLGHDARADRPQPVASRLGPRFYDWQLAQDPAESWAECELHARNLLGPDRFSDRRLEGATHPSPPVLAHSSSTPSATPDQGQLFPDRGSPTAPKG